MALQYRQQVRLSKRAMKYLLCKFAQDERLIRVILYMR